MPFQPRYGDVEQRLEHLEREFIRLGQSGQNANQQAQGSSGDSPVVVTGGGGGGSPTPSQIPEELVVFDPTGGHDHSSGNATAVPMSGDVTGTNQAAVVAQLQGKPVPAAPAATDAGKALRYDGSANYVLDGERLRVRSVSAATSFGADDDVILGDTTGGAFSVNLPAVAASNRRVYTLKRVNAGANNLTLQANGAETIDGANTYVLTAQWKLASVVCNGTAWYLVSQN